MKDTNKDKVNELVSAIDSLMQGGSSHVSVNVMEEDGELQMDYNCTSCNTLGACAQPTEKVDED